MNKIFVSSCFICLIALGIFSCSALLPIFSMYSWHDHQRIAEVFFISVICILCVVNFKILGFPSWQLVYSFFVLGIASSMASNYFGWALQEWARFLGLFLVGLFFSRAGCLHWVRRSVFFILFLIGFFLSFQFINYYIMAFLTGIRNLDSYFLLYGFDNPRFLAQFQVVRLPMLAVFLSQARESGRRSWYIVILGVLLVQWMMAWSMAGRGLLFGLIIALTALYFVRKDFSKFILVQVYMAVSGYLLYLMFFGFVPYLLDFPVLGRDILRYGFSGRLEIWLIAVDMLLESPVLGVGPMHYSAVWNNVAAHPHQLFLLIISEWGVPAFLLFVYLAVAFLRRASSSLRNASATDLDGGIWLVLVAALFMAQVDGVLVMPYGEVWLVTVIGIGVSRWGKAGGLGGALLLVPFALSACLVLSFVLFVYAPDLLRKEEAFLKDNSIGSPPRFWGQGWIPM